MPTTRARRRRRLAAAVLVHPFESALGLILLLLALQELGVGIENRVDRAVDHRIALAWTAGNLLGAAGILAGVFRSDLAEARAVEKAGLYLVASTTAVYAVASLAVVGADAAYGAANLLAVAVACVIRAVAISRAEAAVLRALHNVATGEAEVHPVELVQPRRRATDRRK